MHLKIESVRLLDHTSKTTSCFMQIVKAKQVC